MANRDVVGGLKNAIERGDSLEKAKESFIAAGYNPRDVEEAARSLQAGSVMMEQNEMGRIEFNASPPVVQEVKKEIQNKKIEAFRNNNPALVSLATNQEQKKKSGIFSGGDRLKITLLIGVLVLLFVILVLVLIFRESILTWVEQTFG